MAATTTIRIDPETRDRLGRLSKRRNVSAAAMIRALIEEAEAKELVDGFNEDFAALRADGEAWAEHQAETAAWDGTLGDAAA